MMTTEQKIDRLTDIVDTLASTVVAHDNQIDGLIKVAEKHEIELARIESSLASLERQWQAYIRTLPRQ